MSDDRPWVFFRYPPITHNPWHPAFELTEQGRSNVRREIVENFADYADKEVPRGHGWTLFIGDEAFAGRVPA